MKIHKIDLNTLIPEGHVAFSTDNGEFIMAVTHNSAFKNRYKGIAHPYGNEFRIPSDMKLPGKYKVPFCLKMKLKADSPDLFFLIGNGIISFGPFSTEHIKILDISGVPFKKHQGFYNDMPVNEYFDINITYSFDFMQIKINEEVRYYSEDEIYMKSKTFSQLNNEGLEIKVTGSKHSELVIKECTITEYEDNMPVTVSPTNIPSEYLHHNQITKKPDFDFCISILSENLKKEVIYTDEFILNLKNLKLKRKIEKKNKCCTVNYISSHGFAYHINIDRYMLTHDMWWILYNTKREEKKYGGMQKCDLTNNTLDRLYEISPEFAAKMFGNLRDCTGCSEVCGVGCFYEYKGGKKRSCHGRMEFKMTPSDFADARKVIETIDAILHETI